VIAPITSAATTTTTDTDERRDMVPSALDPITGLVTEG
jgi:hypothetical protein